MDKEDLFYLSTRDNLVERVVADFILLCPLPVLAA